MSDDDERERTVVKRDGPNLFIYEEGEFCCVCESTDYGTLGRYGFGDPASPLEFTVCNSCRSSNAFRDWLAGEFEKVLASRPDQWRKNPDGTWTEIKNPAQENS